MQEQALRDLQDLVIEAVQTREYGRARRLIESVAADAAAADRYRDLLEKQKAHGRKLEEQLQAREEPPLTRALVLGPSPDDERNAIVGAGGQRLEVRITPRVESGEVRPGWEAWLSEDRSIAKVRPSASCGEVAEVVSVLEDGRLEVQSRGHEATIVDRIPALAKAEVSSGDRVRIEAQLGVALEKLPRQENRDLELEAVPDVSYAQIGGLDEHIEQVREAIELPYLYQHLYRRYQLRRPKGILLYGPPGCGKTLIAKAIANGLTAGIRRNLEAIAGALELLVRLAQGAGEAEIGPAYGAWQRQLGRDAERTVAEPVQPAAAAAEQPQPPAPEIERQLHAFLAARGVEAGGAADLEQQHRLAREKLQDRLQAYFMSIKGPELLDKYVGETELSIRRLFLQAKRRATTATPVVMFFDEIEALFRRRGSRVSSDMESTVVPQLLSEMDGVEELGNVIIIGATNRQDLLDPAILRPGRLDLKIKIERPGRVAARSIFAKYLLEDLPLAPAEIAAAGSRSAAVRSLIDRAVTSLYASESRYRVTGDQLDSRTFACREFVSGAMIESIVNRHKLRALRRERDGAGEGMTWSDLRDAMREELEQNQDQLVASALGLPEEGLTIELELAGAGPARPAEPWRVPIRRPWARRQAAAQPEAAR